MHIENVLIVTDDQWLANAVSDFQWPDGLHPSIISVSALAHLAPIGNNTAIMVDARTISPDDRRSVAKIGKSDQRIAFGDPEFDNRLAKTHLPSGATIEELVGAISSVEWFISNNPHPPALKLEEEIDKHPSKKR